MIIGAHSIIHSKKPEADRAFLRDVLGLTNVDVGGGWLIFGLPPAEVAVHPSDVNDVHEFYLMCADIETTIAEMKRRRIHCEAPRDMGWGRLTHLRLPGGGKLGVYEPLHERPAAMSLSGLTGRKRPGRKKATGRPGATQPDRATRRRRRSTVTR